MYLNDYKLILAIYQVVYGDGTLINRYFWLVDEVGGGGDLVGRHSLSREAKTKSLLDVISCMLDEDRMEQEVVFS